MRFVISSFETFGMGILLVDYLEYFTATQEWMKVLGKVNGGANYCSKAPSPEAMDTKDSTPRLHDHVYTDKPLECPQRLFWFVVHGLITAELVLSANRSAGIALTTLQKQI